MTFVELKEKQMQQNEESFKKYMYALELRQEAAEHIGIENIRRSRLQKLQKEKANIEAQHRKGSQVYPDFRLIMMARLRRNRCLETMCLKNSCTVYEKNDAR